MDERTAGKCTVAICHTEEIKETLFYILDRMKCSIRDISSLDDIINLVQDSDFEYLQFSDRTSSQRGIFLETNENNNSQTIKGNDNKGDASVYQKFTLFEIEKFIILNTLNKCCWNKKAAAKILGIDRATIYRKIKKLGIIKPE